jgi:hypothetical protein
MSQFTTEKSAVPSSAAALLREMRGDGVGFVATGPSAPAIPDEIIDGSASPGLGSTT